MFICQPCLLSKNPDYANSVPDQDYHTTDCQICGKQKLKCVIVPQSILDPTSQPTTKPTTQPTTPTTKPKKEKYQYLLIGWETSDMFNLFTTKEDLLKAIQHHVFTLSCKDIDIYKLTPLPHKAEIKVEVDEK